MSPAAAAPSNPIMAKLREVMDPVDFAAIDIPALIIDQQGDPATNMSKYGAKWQWLPATSTPFPVALAASYGASSQAIATIARPGVQGGDMEILGFLGRSTGRFGVLPNMQSLNLDLANTPLASGLVFGKAPGGAPACVTQYEPASGAVVFKQLTNLTAIQNNVECVPYGRRFVGQEAQETIEARRSAFLSTRINSFWMGADPGQNGGQAIEFTLAAGQTMQLNYTVPTIGDFLAITPVDDSSYSSGATGRPALSVLIQDGLSGYQLMPQALSVCDYVAACNMPLADPLLVPAGFDGPFSGIFTHVFSRGTAIVCFFTNNDMSSITVRFGFRGILLRYKPAQGRATNTSAEVRASILARSSPMPFLNVAQGGRS